MKLCYSVIQFDFSSTDFIWKSTKPTPMQNKTKRSPESLQLNEKACTTFLAILESLQLPSFMPSLIFTSLFSEAKKRNKTKQNQKMKQKNNNNILLLAGACEQSTLF